MSPIKRCTFKACSDFQALKVFDLCNSLMAIQLVQISNLSYLAISVHATKTLTMIALTTLPLRAYVRGNFMCRHTVYQHANKP